MFKIICPDKGLVPTRGTEGSAGLDLKLSNDVHIFPGNSTLVGTGVRMEVPKGFMGMVVPRSSTGKKNLELANGVGIIDSDYQGEIKLNIRNVGSSSYLGYKYDTLFQLIIVPVSEANPILVQSFEKVTKRAEGGFGSTDI